MLEIRESLRSLFRDRLYSLITVLTFGLTIGATTAVFSIVDGVLLKPLGYADPGRLVSVREIWRQFSDKYPTLPVNERHFEYWRAHATSFESVAEFLPLSANFTGVGDAAQIVAVHASSTLFDVLRVAPALGRTLTSDDEVVGRPRAAVITDAFWRQRFGGDPAAVGRPIGIDGKPYVVVGVLPPGLALPAEDQLTAKFDVVVPIRVDEDHVGWAGEHNTIVVARLAPGRTLADAAAELDVLQAQVSKLAADEAKEPVTLLARVQPLNETIVGSARRGLLLLLAAIAAVLLIACSNLANLSLTRTIGNAREIAVRAALGATRGRVVARVLVEQAVLAATGGALGLAVAWGALVAFVRTAPIDLPRLGDIALDGRVLAFAIAISGGTALIVGLLPAWYAGRRDVQAALRTGGGTFTSDRHGLNVRATLVSVQVALSVALVAVTALLTVSFVRLLKLDKGFTAERVIAVPVSMPASRYAEAQARISAYDRMLEAVHRLPGVQAAATSSSMPLSGQSQVNFVAVEGRPLPMAQQPTANFRYIAPEFFRTLGVRVVRGRPFAADERHADRPAPSVISESVAARLWPGEDSIGKHFSRGQHDEQGLEVVGVAADARTTSLDRVPPLMVYVPYWWASPSAQRTSTTLLIKTANDPTAVVPTVRHALRQMDPEIAVGEPRTVDALVDRSLAGRRYQMRLFVVFGAAALFIATLGVYAVTAYGVSRRRREMNIRAALGASTRQVLALVVRQGAVPLAVGVIVGVAGAVALSTVVSTLLFDVSARDPKVIAGVAALVAIVGTAATFAAAAQGLALNPASALRDE